MPISLTAYQGRAGDRNDLAWPGTLMIDEAVSSQLNCPFAVVGEPKPVLNRDWELELAAAAPDLARLADRMRSVLSNPSSVRTELVEVPAPRYTLASTGSARTEPGVVNSVKLNRSGREA